MIVAGINIASTKYNKELKDGGLCIIEDGNIRFAIAEERVSRKKRAGGFQEAFQYALNKLNLTKSDIDLIVYSSCCEKVRPDFRIKNFEDIKSIPCNHHYSHALGVYLTSPFDESIIIVLDAGGNVLNSDSDSWWASRREQHSYFIARGHNIELHSVDFDKPRAAGIAEVYRAFTHYLGWPSSNYANKVMALSALGDGSIFPRKEIFSMNAHGYLTSAVENNPKEPLLMIYSLLRLHSLEEMLPRCSDEPIKKYHIDLSRWIQNESEKAIFSKTNWLIKQTGILNVCFSGGVAYNCSAIGKLLENTDAKNIFVQPASGDHGQCLGNAIHGYLMTTGKWDRKSFFNPFLGGEELLSFEKINDFIKEHSNLHIQKYDNLPFVVAELLVKNNIVAWFQGRSEYGPRALGNRSILVSPLNLCMKDMLNVIKSRESFMPFAPSVLAERAEDFFDTSFESPYMTAAFKVKKNKASLISAVVHTDGTSRVQMVRKEHNRKFYEVISRFYALTNIPLILNTSFNGPCEPIVETLKDAIDTFLRLDIIYLAIGDFLIEKRELKTEGWTVQVSEKEFKVYLDETITSNLAALLHKRFPFMNLIQREKIQLYSEYVDWLRNGRKTTTIRFKRNGIEYPLQRKMFLSSTDSFKPGAFETPVGCVTISHFTVKRFKDLSSDDAVRDGFNNLNELRAVLKEIYKGISAEDFVSIYTIKLNDEKSGLARIEN